MQKDYSNIISNNDKDVFIPLVPSVLGAMLMSKVSRQKEGFREDLIQMVESDMVSLPEDNYHELFKNSVVVANGFMEKWGVNYGHSSIKELDTLQMCLENRSRWFTEILETLQTNKYMSYIEYSLRYNPPKAYYTPVELDQYPDLKDAYIEFSDYTFKVYDELKESFFAMLKEKYPDKTDRQVELLAFENARNVLPLSTKANMGMQSNLRAFCDGVSELLAYEGLNDEIASTGLMMKEEAEKVSVGMVRHVEPSDYQKSYIKAIYSREDIREKNKIYRQPVVEVDENIVGDMTRLKHLGEVNLMNRFDGLPSYTRTVGKYLTVYMSEGAHHQFLRHRAFDLIPKIPDVKYGMILPKEVVESDSETARIIEKKMIEVYEKSCDLYEKFWDAELYHIAPYTVINCNVRKADFFGNLFGMAHFITLRKEEHAQDEIRYVAGEMHKEFKVFENVIPGLRLDKNE